LDARSGCDGKFTPKGGLMWIKAEEKGFNAEGTEVAHREHREEGIKKDGVKFSARREVDCGVGANRIDRVCRGR
jgi:hypothetical protein